MRALITLVLLGACSFSTTAGALPVLDPIPDEKAAATSPYLARSERDRLAYVEARVKRISASIAAPGSTPITITPEAVRLVRETVDKYALRVGSNETRPGKGDLGPVLERGAAVAAAIRRAFEGEGVPPAIGLYVAMIESEYHPCLTSSMGARGMFQFLPATGQKYGIAPEDLCDLEKAAPAAARYLRTRRAEFGTDALGTTLSILSYNIGERALRSDFQGVIAARQDREQAFWNVLAKPDPTQLSKHFVQEGIHYIPLFYAAAIVGENPQEFGLATKPLSSY